MGSFVSRIAAGLVVCVLAQPGLAQVFTWGAGGDGSSWNDPDNWIHPTINDYPRFNFDTALIGGAGAAGSGNPPILNENITLGDLQIILDADVFSGFITNHSFNVANTTLISGTGSRLLLFDSPASVDLNTGGLTINGTGQTLAGLELNGGTVQVNDNVSIDSGGTIRAVTDSTIFLNSTTGNFVNDGTIVVDEDRTLTIAGTGGNTGLFDWDGANGNTAFLSVGTRATLDIDLSTGGDAYGGTIGVGFFAEFNNASNWTLDNGGTINFFGGTTGAPGIIRGGTVTTRGTVNMSNRSGRFDTTWNATDGTITMGTTGFSQLSVDGGSIAPAADVFFGEGNFIVSGDFLVDQTGKLFDWDGTSNDVRTLVNRDSSLTVRANSINPNTGAFTENRFSGLVDLSGDLTVTGFGPDLLIAKTGGAGRATLRMRGDDGGEGPDYFGLPIVFGSDSTFEALEDFTPGFVTGEFRAPVRFDGGTISIEPMMIVAFHDPVEFRGGSSDYGTTGIIFFLNDVLVNTTTPLDMPSESIDFRNGTTVTLINNATMNINQSANGFGAVFNGGSNSTVNVNGHFGFAGSAVTTFNVTTFDMDGGSGEITINSSATLDLNVTRINSLNDLTSGILNISGTLDVNNAANSWTSAGGVNLDSGRILGDSFAMTVGGLLTNTGDSTIATTTFAFGSLSAGQINGTLTLDTDARINQLTTFTGTGSLVVPSSGTIDLFEPDLATVSLDNAGSMMITAVGIGDVAGIVEMNDYTQRASGDLRIVIGGFTPGFSVDQVIVDGDASLDGVLDLSRIGFFDPALYQSVLIMPVAGSLSGNFDQIDNMVINSTKALAITYEPAGVLLTVAIPGDFDLDGDVDLQDFNLLAAGFGLTGGAGTWAFGDTDGDGDVDLTDFNNMAANFGLDVTPEMFARLPEPGLAGLVLLGAVAGSRTVRRL